MCNVSSCYIPAHFYHSFTLVIATREQAPRQAGGIIGASLSEIELTKAQESTDWQSSDITAGAPEPVRQVRRPPDQCFFPK